MKSKTIFFIIGFFPLFFFSGCYTWYHEKTIGKKEIKQNLIDPDLKQIVIGVAKIKHPALKPVIIDLENGISPDEAAVIAVYLNPSLKVRRTKFGIAEAQLTQVGILPNPVFSYTFDSPVGGNTLGSFNAYGFGLSWDITSLVSLLPKVKSQEFNRNSVELNIAWQEFLTAQNSKMAVYKNIVLAAQIELLKAWEKEISDKITYIRQGLKIGATTELTFSTVQNMKNDIHTTLLKKQREKQTQILAFKRILGLSPAYPVKIEAVNLPLHVKTASSEAYMKEITHRRLDFLALNMGYKSQEKAVMVSILEQIPRISIGFNHARDTGNLQTLGFGVAVSVPIFDRNQGHIAIERAMREKLYQEYMFRIFTARADIAKLLSIIENINKQIKDFEEIIPQQKALLKHYKTALSQGNGDIIVYFNVMKGLISKQIQLLNLQYDLLINKTRLAVVSGFYNSEDVLKKQQEKK